MESDDNMSLRVASFSCYLDTAKDNLVHRVSGQETPIKPPITIKFSRPKDTTQDNPTSLRVDSFNSYLNSAGDHNFVFEVPGPIQDPTSAFTFSRETPKDGEIDVFNADKYFNMKLEYQTESKQTESKLSYNKGVPARLGLNIRPRTPSLCSEESSWNSQTTFLPHLHRSESLTKQKKGIGRRIFTGFSCKGPCFDKKSVHINEIVAQGANNTSKTSRIGSERIDGHDLTVKKNLDESRPSIEVFGSSNTSTKGDVATNMERKLSILTWDAIPTLPPSTVGSSVICDERASDVSSDLFEIENISGSIYPLTSEPEYDMSGCMSPTSLYAPTEASIQWSVVTASAADCSLLSDYNDETSVTVAGDVMPRKITGPKMGGKEAKRSGPGGLLGCKSHKAVDVAENVCVKGNEKVKNQGPVPDLSAAASFGKAQARSKLFTNVVV